MLNSPRLVTAYPIQSDFWRSREHERVALTSNLPAERLTQGDVGTVIQVYGGGKALEVEFVALDGETVAVVTLDASKVRPVSYREITHARSVS